MRYLHSFLILPLLACAGVANAGVYSDEMTKCLISSSSPQDKVTLVRWVFGISSLHPDVAPLSRISASQRNDMDRSVAALYEKLLTQTCRKQTEDAIRYEGVSAIQTSFNALGQAAMRELMSNEKVAAGAENFTNYLDKKKIEAMVQEGASPQQ